MSDFYYAFRRLRSMQRENIFPYPGFTQPFGGREWQVGQGAVGWLYDAANSLATNDGTYGATQYLYCGFTTIPVGNYQLEIEVVQHPGGGSNFGSVLVSFGGGSFNLPATPAIFSLAISAQASNNFVFLPNGNCRIAIKSIKLSIA